MLRVEVGFFNMKREREEKSFVYRIWSISRVCSD